jgi:acetyltransferase-like isoleucine patch superfamily enzyme
MLKRGVRFYFRKIKLVKAKINQLFFDKILKRPFYKKLPKGLLLLNFICQRIFGINKSVPFSVYYTSSIYGFENIILPENDESIKISFTVSGGCFITVFKGTTLEIGENTIWAFNVCVQTGNHDLYDRNVYHTKSVKIGKNCWIGNSVTILAGVELGDNVTIGANSVVTKSFPSNVVIGGVPAKILKEI